MSRQLHAIGDEVNTQIIKLNYRIATIVIVNIIIEQSFLLPNILKSKTKFYLENGHLVLQQKLTLCFKIVKLIKPFCWSEFFSPFYITQHCEAIHGLRC